MGHFKSYQRAWANTITHPYWHQLWLTCFRDERTVCQTYQPGTLKPCYLVFLIPSSCTDLAVCKTAFNSKTVLELRKYSNKLITLKLTGQIYVNQILLCTKTFRLVFFWHCEKQERKLKTQKTPLRVTWKELVIYIQGLLFISNMNRMK